MHCKLNMNIPSLCIDLNKMCEGKAQKLTGQCPLSPWKLSTESMDNVHRVWTMTMDSVDIVQSNRSNTPAGQCPWKMSTEAMDISTDGKVRLTLKSIYMYMYVTVTNFHDSVILPYIFVTM